MLYAEFPLGRPLGRPNDPAFQRRVLESAFALVRRTDVPVLVDFPVIIEDESDQPLACTIPLAHDPALHPAIAEALGLRAAYERNRAATGRTFVSRVGNANRVRELIEVLVRLADGVPLDDCGMPAGQLGAAALDVRAYYEKRRWRSPVTCRPHVRLNRGSSDQLRPERCCAGRALPSALLTDPARHGSRWSPSVNPNDRDTTRLTPIDAIRACVD